jgi:hypothetical protein
MVMLIELAGQLSDKEKWLEALDKDFRNVCKVRYDEVRFAAKGTIPTGAKRIVDERTY